MNQNDDYDKLIQLYQTYRISHCDSK